MGPGVTVALKRGAEEARRSPRLVLGLWSAGAAAGAVAAAPWTASWAHALRASGAGYDLARGFDLMLLGDLVRRAGPGIGALRGWALGAGLAYLLLMAILQGGAIRLLAVPRTQRSAALFGEACGKHAAAMAVFAGLSLAVAAACASFAGALLRAAETVERGGVGSTAAAALRLASVAGGVVLFAFLQIVLELARLDRVTTGDAGWLLSLSMASRFAVRRPLRCLAIYAAAAAVSVAALGVGLALARAAGALGSGWGVGVWAAAQFFLLVRWGARVGMWAGLGVAYGAIAWKAH